MRIKIGVDEAGRGPWAGPVYAGLVVVSEEQESLLREAGINDSKKLTKKKRELLYPLILENSLYAKVKRIAANDIDTVGIYKATIALIKQLVAELDSLELAKNHGEVKVLIDGVFPSLTLMDKFNAIVEHECIIKGDAKEPAISAASILAKVKRDKYMDDLAVKYPEYQFEKHKGYGTKLHSDMLEKYGPCEEHRRSFKPIAKFLR